MSLQRRLILYFALVGILSTSLLSTVLNISLTSDAKEVFQARSQDKLVASREQKRGQLESYIAQIRQQLIQEAGSAHVIQSTLGIAAAFSEIKSGSVQLDIPNGPLLRYYQDEFNQEYKRQNRSEGQWQSQHDGMSKHARFMQHHYIALNRFPLGEKHKLEQANSYEVYDRLHQQYHPEFVSFLETWGYYDVFIVNLDGDIVYSVFKELDYATNLETGPYAESGIADSYKKGKALDFGQTALSDFRDYVPSYDNDAAFISTPIFSEDQKIGVLIYQISIDRINNIMTNNGQWKTVGMGDSAETYLVGSQGKLISESRFFVEDPDTYFEVLTQVGMKDVAELVKAKGSSVGVQPVSTEGVRLALKGESGISEFEDYRGVPVFSAFTALDLGDGVTWALMSEIDVEEALSPVSVLQAHQLYSTFAVMALVILTCIGVAWLIANKLSAPIRKLADLFLSISSGEGDLTQRIENQKLLELQSVKSGFNGFLEQIEAIIQQVKVSGDNLNRLANNLEDAAVQTTKSTSDQEAATVQVANNMEQYIEAIHEVARNTEEASSESTDAASASRKSAEQSRSASHQINSLVNKLNDSQDVIQKLETEVHDIKEVLNTITSIADQTNLLALNAAIEAARAGEQGRGFAVVADEVRTLAARTQQTTVEIQNKMDELQTAAQNSVSTIHDASELAHKGSQEVIHVAEQLDDLEKRVLGVTQKNDSIAAASTEQLQTAQDITNSIDKIKDISQSVNSSSINVRESIEQMHVIAMGINVLMNRFQVRGEELLIAESSKESPSLDKLTKLSQP